MKPVAYPASHDGPSRAFLWQVASLYAIVAALVLIAAGIHIHPLEYVGLLIPIAAGAGLAALHSRLGANPVRRLAEFFEALALVGAIGLCGGFASVGLAAFSGNFLDGELARIDASIGVDWAASYRFVASHSWLQMIGRRAYRSIFFTPIILFALLCATGRSGTVRQTIAAHSLALAVTLVVFPLAPAAGPLTKYGLANAGYVPITNDLQAQLIELTRAGRFTCLHSKNLIGVVSFPSFHAASALIFTWAAWRLPVARWISLVVNLAMLCATPIEGNHYVVDLIGGFAVGAFGIVMPRRLTLGHCGESRPVVGVLKRFHRLLPISPLSTGLDPHFSLGRLGSDVHGAGVIGTAVPASPRAGNGTRKRQVTKGPISAGRQCRGSLGSGSGASREEAPEESIFLQRDAVPAVPRGSL